MSPGWGPIRCFLQGVFELTPLHLIRLFEVMKPKLKLHHWIRSSYLKFWNTNLYHECLVGAIRSLITLTGSRNPLTQFKLHDTGRPQIGLSGKSSARLFRTRDRFRSDSSARSSDTVRRPRRWTRARRRGDGSGGWRSGKRRRRSGAERQTSRRTDNPTGWPEHRPPHCSPVHIQPINQIQIKSDHLLNSGSHDCLFVLLVFNDTFSINRLYHAIGVWNCVGLEGGGTHSNIDKSNKRKIHTNTLFHLGFVEIISSLMKVSSEGSFYSQSLGKYWQLNQNN